jgi:hypothetical protein
VRLEGLDTLKNALTSSGLEPKNLPACSILPLHYCVPQIYWVQYRISTLKLETEPLKRDNHLQDKAHMLAPLTRTKIKKNVYPSIASRYDLVRDVKQSGC